LSTREVCDQVKRKEEKRFPAKRSEQSGGR